MDKYLTGELKHKAQRPRPGRSRIGGSLLFDEFEAMERFHCPSESEWFGLPRNERAMKIAYVWAKNFIEVVGSFEANEDAKRKKK